MSEIATEDLLRVATEDGGALEGRFSRTGHPDSSVREKTCAADVVTEADFESQQTIYEIIHRAFPRHGFLGEEGLNQAAEEGCGYRWIIDPLDGTSNYVHGFPYYAVSIGVEHQGEMQAGVIFDPTRDEMFSARRGGGAWCNGRQLSVSRVSAMNQALLVASFPPGAGSGSLAIQQFLKILPQAQTVQRTGSAAMNLANLAAGRLDGFWSFSLKAWDMAAGVLIVCEAGGTISRTDGGPLQLEVPNILASNGTELHAHLQHALAN